MYYLGCCTRQAARRSRGVGGCTLRLRVPRNAVIRPKNILIEAAI